MATIDSQVIEAHTAYRDLMFEIRHRIGALRKFSIDEPIREGIARILGREFCFLQVRMICESIGLACVVAQGAVSGFDSAPFSTWYNPEQIMKKLGKLHPNFYPQPVQPVRTGNESWDLRPLKSGFVTKEELLKLYDKCGRHLHRGSLNELSVNDRGAKGSLAEFTVIADKVQTLLSSHFIALVDPHQMQYCYLDDGQGNVVVGSLLQKQS